MGQRDRFSEEGGNKLPCLEGRIENSIATDLVLVERDDEAIVAVFEICIHPSRYVAK